MIVIASEAKQSRGGAPGARLLRRHSPSKTGVNALLPRNSDVVNQTQLVVSNKFPALRETASAEGAIVTP
jgi:hypothetical protein